VSPSASVLPLPSRPFLWLGEGPESFEGSLSRSGTSYLCLSERTRQKGATVLCRLQDTGVLAGHAFGRVESSSRESSHPNARLADYFRYVSAIVCRVPCMMVKFRSGCVTHSNVYMYRGSTMLLIHSCHGHHSCRLSGWPKLTLARRFEQVVSEEGSSSTAVLVEQVGRRGGLRPRRGRSSRSRPLRTPHTGAEAEAPQSCVCRAYRASIQKNNEVLK